MNRKTVLWVFAAVGILTTFVDQAVCQVVTHEIIKEKTENSFLPVYRHIFRQGEKVVAERLYKNEKEIMAEGVIPDGMVVELYPDGRVMNISFYVGGKLNGPAIGLYPNGRVKGYNYFKDDILNGKAYYYFESGEIRSESELVDGKEMYHWEYTEEGKRGRHRTDDDLDVTD